MDGESTSTQEKVSFSGGRLFITKLMLDHRYRFYFDDSLDLWQPSVERLGISSTRRSRFIAGRVLFRTSSRFVSSTLEARGT
jgi:hypothetical protein